MTLAGAAGYGCCENRDDHLGRVMIIWVSKCKTSLARQACVRGKRDDHLGRLMIIWVRKGKTSLARQACVRGKRDDHLGRLMIIWVG